MNIKHCFWGLLMFLKASEGIAQDSTSRFTFILSIDNIIVNQSLISETYFELKSKNGPECNIIPFEFRVGALLLKNADYNKLFSIKRSDSLFIHFKFLKNVPDSYEKAEYRKQIPSDWINDQYIIFLVYNYSNKESRKKYALKKGGYGIEIKVPGAGSVIPRWSRQSP